MVCNKCNKVFPAQCMCLDRDARFKSICSMSNIVLAFCSACGEHDTLCKCPPETEALWELRASGQIVGHRPRRS